MQVLLGNFLYYEIVSQILRGVWLQFQDWKKSHEKLGALAFRL